MKGRARRLANLMWKILTRRLKVNQIMKNSTKELTPKTWDSHRLMNFTENAKILTSEYRKISTIVILMLPT